MSNLEWTRPLALWSLVAPLLVVLLSFRRDRPLPVSLGTFALWQRSAAGGGESRRRRVTLARWFWAACLACTALALAGPRLAGSRAKPVLRVVLDRSPSMFLPHTDAQGEPTGRGTRLEAALAELERRVELQPYELRWTSRSTERGADLEALPPAWRTGPGPRDGLRSWASFDAGDCLWVGDALDVVPRVAGHLAAGGGPAYGPAAREGERVFAWGADGLHELAERAAPRRVRADPQLPALLAGLVEAWCEARGHDLAVLRGVGAVGESGGAPPDLELHAVPVSGSSAQATRTLGRDGWSLTGPVAVAPVAHAGAPLETWLADGRPRITFARGHVFWGLAGEDLGGDPAAFAVSVSHLLDRALPPAPGIVAVAERAAAGEGSFALPAGADGLAAAERGPGEDRPLAAALAACALGLGLLALALRHAALR